MNEETTARAPENEIPADYGFDGSAQGRLSLTLMGKIMVLWVLIVAITIAIGASKAKASEAVIDLSALTDEQIIALSQQVSKEIVDRKIQKTATVPAGTYIIGVDIPAGKYVYVIATKDDDFYRKSVRVLEGNGSDEILAEYYVGGLKSSYITTMTLSLADGNELYSEAPFTLTTNPVVLFE